jgi:GDP-4-dehydro-6-deoxy-D-mannose reductase
VRILVTGAGGFVGRHLLPVLADRYPEATLITPSATALDITDSDALDGAIARIQPDACIHLAGVAAISEAKADPVRAWRVNLHGTLHLATAILRHAPCCRLVHASSADIYGASFRAGVALDERAPAAPLNVYGSTKAAADLALGAMAQDGLRVVRLRPFNHTGPGQSDQFVVPAFARQVMRIAAGLQEPVLSVGDLTPLRDFLDVRDVCAAYAACLRPDLDITPGTILNIASGQPRRISDVLQALLQMAGVSARIETAGRLLRPSDIPFAAGHAEAAHTVLGWKPTIPFAVTLADVIADWRVRVAAA